MDVNVKHGLTGADSIVEYDSIGGNQVLLTGDALRDQQQVSQHLLVFGCRLVERGDMLLRDHEDVARRLRTDISEGERRFRFGYDIRRQLSLGNLTKQAILHGFDSTSV